MRRFSFRVVVVIVRNVVVGLEMLFIVLIIIWRLGGGGRELDKVRREGGEFIIVCFMRVLEFDSICY